MSFILDALKKSETDRQQQGSAEFAGVPTNPGKREGPPRWLWVLGALLLINLAVLVGIMMRPGTPPETAAESQTSEPPPAVENDFAERVAVSRQNAPSRETLPVVEKPQADTPSPSLTVAHEPMNTATLPTIHEVQANGQVSLPELHVDIHVYSESPEDRFVFINMNKHNQGSRLAEGPLVEEITPDGVVLVHNGITFLLPRD